MLGPRHHFCLQSISSINRETHYLYYLSVRLQRLNSWKPMPNIPNSCQQVFNTVISNTVCLWACVSVYNLGFSDSQTIRTYNIFGLPKRKSGWHKSLTVEANRCLRVRDRIVARVKISVCVWRGGGSLK